MSNAFFRDKTGLNTDNPAVFSGCDEASFAKYAWTKINRVVKVENHMFSLKNPVKSTCFWGILLFCSITAWGQPALVRQGFETKLLTSTKGDKINSALSLFQSGGYVAWNDNAIDKSGQGIAVTPLNLDTVTGAKAIQVNSSATGNQIRPQIQRLKNGQNLIVWQGSPAGMPDIYARILKTNNAFTTTLDIRVNAYTRDQQVAPAVTALQDGGAVIAWSSYMQDGDMMGVYARKMTATGTLPAGEFRVNQITAYNQRDPAIATLKNGNFVVVWISENESSFGSVDVYGRIFTPACVPVTGEFRINRSKDKCAEPAVAALPDGGFTVVWAQYDSAELTNGWDVFGSCFGPTGQSKTPPFKINTYLTGDQYRPKIASGSVGCMVVWTSVGQDAPEELDNGREGVFGRFLLGGSQPVGDELQVNTTTISQQLYPSVAWNGVDRFLVVWSSPTAIYGFNLFGQAYILQ